jgi:hypothetical protein
MPELWTPPQRVWTPPPGLWGPPQTKRARHKRIRRPKLWAGFVQVCSNVGFGTPSSVQAIFASAQSTGDLNVVAVIIAVGTSGGTGAATSVTDSSGNYGTGGPGTGYSLVGSQEGYANTVYLYYAWNIVSAAANANTITVNVTGNSYFVEVVGAEYSGVLSTGNPLRTSNEAVNTFGTSDDPTVPLTSTLSSDLIVMYSSNFGWAGSPPLAAASPMVAEYTNSNGGQSFYTVYQDGFLSGGAVNPTATPASSVWCAAAAAFIAAPTSQLPNPYANAVWFDQ